MKSHIGKSIITKLKAVDKYSRVLLVIVLFRVPIWLLFSSYCVSVPQNIYQWSWGVIPYARYKGMWRHNWYSYCTVLARKREGSSNHFSPEIRYVMPASLKTGIDFCHFGRLKRGSILRNWVRNIADWKWELRCNELGGTRLCYRIF